jgi:hypothetical protein
VKERKKRFIQHLHHDIEDIDKSEQYLADSLSLIGDVVVNFNGLEHWLDGLICKMFSDRTDAPGLIVMHKMTFATKVDLFKRFSDDFHRACEGGISNYEQLISTFEYLITNLRECGRLRNLVVHADWENTDDDGYTYVRLKFHKNGMEQEYIQFSKASLQKITDLISTTRELLDDYWEKRVDALND